MVADDNLDVTATSSSQSAEDSEVARIPAAKEDSTKSKTLGWWLSLNQWIFN